MAKEITIRIAPVKKVEFSLSLSPYFKEGKIEELDFPCSDRGVRRVEETAGADAKPMASTGVHASQLHPTDSGATNLE